MILDINRKTFTVSINIFLLILFAGFDWADADWKADWATTIEAAKKEGQVAIYGGYNPRYRKLNQAFEKKFGIKVNYTNMRPESFLNSGPISS